VWHNSYRQLRLKCSTSIAAPAAIAVSFISPTIHTTASLESARPAAILSESSGTVASRFTLNRPLRRGHAAASI
jgi:hypothetical protein